MIRTRRTRDGTRAGVVSRFVSGGLAGVVLGILGMHAFAQHCPDEFHNPMAAASSVVEHVSDAAPVLAFHASTHAQGSAEETGHAVAAPAREDGSLCDTLMLCAFLVLGAGAGLVLALRLRGGFIATRWLRLLHVALPRAPVTRLGTGPPSVWAFAVIRC